MKKRLSILLVACALSITGCGNEIDKQNTTNNEKSTDIESDIDSESNINDESSNDKGSNIGNESSIDKESIIDKEKSTDNKTGNDSERSTDDSNISPESLLDVVTPGSFCFKDLKEQSFTFSSGAGAWSTELYIFEDGYFKGLFHDSDMGSIGEGYSNGTVYCSSFYGHFAEPVMIDDYTFEFEIKDLKYRNTPGTTEISFIDNVRYEYSDAYGLEGTKKFLIYLPGKAIDDFDPDVASWILPLFYRDSDVLEEYVIVNEATLGAMYSEPYDLISSTELTHSSCLESNSYMRDLLNDGSLCQGDCNYVAITMYENMDYDLNCIWDAIKYTCDSDTYNKLLTEQRQWIVFKENEAEAAAAGNEGGTLYDQVYYGRLAKLTLDRCNELIKYLQ